MTILENSADAQLLAFTQIEEYTYAIRFKCASAALFHEIVGTIKSTCKQYRRWDPELFDNRGGWLLDEQVLEELFVFFPTMRHRKRALNAYEAIRNSDRSDPR